MTEHRGPTWWLLPAVTAIGAGLLMGALVTTRPLPLAGAAVWVLGFVGGCVLLDEFAQRVRRRVRHWQVRQMVRQVSSDRAALLRALNRSADGTRRSRGGARRAD